MVSDVREHPSEASETISFRSDTLKFPRGMSHKTYDRGGVIIIEFWNFDPKVGEMVH